MTRHMAEAIVASELKNLEINDVKSLTLIIDAGYRPFLMYFDENGSGNRHKIAVSLLASTVYHSQEMMYDTKEQFLEDMARWWDQLAIPKTESDAEEPESPDPISLN